MPAADLRILLLADTHGTIDGRIVRLALESDVVVHAGDIGGAAVLAALQPRRGRLVAVRGNNDVAANWPEQEGAQLAALPLNAELSLPGGVLVVVHGDRAGGAAGRHARLRRHYPEARAVVYGHSHRLDCDQTAVPWVLNPGAAGRSRTYGGPSCLLLHATESVWRVEVCRFQPVRTIK